MDNETQEDIRTLKDTLRRQIIGLLPVLALQEIGGESHLRSCFSDSDILFHVENKPVLFHNLVALVQEVGCWLWENTRHEEAEADLVFLNEDFRQVIGEDEHPESLWQPELNDHYQAILLSDGSLNYLFDQIGALIEVIREESDRVMALEKTAKRSGYLGKARRIEARYFHLRFMLKEKLLSFFQKFLDAETALNDQQN